MTADWLPVSRDALFEVLDRMSRHDAPVLGNRHLGFAQALVEEMPHTLAALECGALSEWRATLIVRESACGRVSSLASGKRVSFAIARILLCRACQTRLVCCSQVGGCCGAAWAAAPLASPARRHRAETDVIRCMNVLR